MIARHAVANFPFLFDSFGELGALDGHGCEIGQRGEKIEVFFGEAADVNGRVDLHRADDAVPVPQRDAHRRPNAVDGDRLAAQQPRIFQRVGGHQRHLLLRHHLQNGPGDRNVLRFRSFDEPRQLGHGIAFLIEEDEQPALDRQVAEDHVHHHFEQRVQVLTLQHRFGHLHQDLKDLLARDFFRNLQPGGSGDAGNRFLRLGQIEAELGIEISDPADHGSLRVIEHRLIAEVHRRKRFDFELHGTDEDLVARIDLRLGDQVSVDLDAVRRFEVDDPDLVVSWLDPGVFPGDRRMVEHQVVSLGAPHRQLPAKVGYTLHAEIDVVDLELLHDSRLQL